MAIGLLGTKIGMTQLFKNSGEAIPVTIIKCGPCFITQIKENIIQLGYVEIKKNSKQLTKPLLGHFLKNASVPYYFLKEYNINNTDNYQVGQKYTVDIFHVEQKVSISGLTIGKGNTGNIKRNHFTRGGMAHGSKHHRLQGSLGAGTSPGRVFPGKKMPGRVGMENRTISGLEIVYIDILENLIAIKGNLPGKIGNLMNIMPDTNTF